MNRDRMPLFGAGLALLVLVMLVTVDLSIPPGHAVLTSLFGLSPLIACAVVPVPGTAAIGALAIGAAFASGWWNGTMGAAQQHVRILDVVLVSVAAVAIAAVRVHREHQFAELSAIAEAAQRAILPVVPTHLGGVAVATRWSRRWAVACGSATTCRPGPSSSPCTRWTSPRHSGRPSSRRATPWPRPSASPPTAPSSRVSAPTSSSRSPAGGHFPPGSSVVP